MTGFPLPVGFMLWLGAALLLGMLEIFTTGFFALFFAGGALITAAFAWLIPSWQGQVLIFIVSSLLLVMLARPIFKKTFAIGEQPAKESNVSALVGAEVLVLEPVDKYTGKAKVIHTGEVWSAYMAESFAHERLEAGSPALIDSVDGAKLAIRPKPGE